MKVNHIGSFLVKQAAKLLGRQRIACTVEFADVLDLEGVDVAPDWQSIVLVRLVGWARRGDKHFGPQILQMAGQRLHVHLGAAYRIWVKAKWHVDNLHQIDQPMKQLFTDPQ
jgi:hypothetical protein